MNSNRQKADEKLRLALKMLNREKTAQLSPDAHTFSEKHEKAMKYVLSGKRYSNTRRYLPTVAASLVIIVGVVALSVKLLDNPDVPVVERPQTTAVIATTAQQPGVSSSTTLNSSTAGQTTLPQPPTIRVPGIQEGITVPTIPTMPYFTTKPAMTTTPATAQTLPTVPIITVKPDETANNTTAVQTNPQQSPTTAPKTTTTAPLTTVPHIIETSFTTTTRNMTVTTATTEPLTTTMPCTTTPPAIVTTTTRYIPTLAPTTTRQPVTTTTAVTEQATGVMPSQTHLTTIPSMPITTMPLTTAPTTTPLTTTNTTSPSGGTGFICELNSSGTSIVGTNYQSGTNANLVRLGVPGFINGSPVTELRSGAIAKLPQLEQIEFFSTSLVVDDGAITDCSSLRDIYFYGDVYSLGKSYSDNALGITIHCSRGSNIESICIERGWYYVNL